MNPILLLVLRLLHIGGGLLWVGAAVVYFAFIGPTLKTIGPASGPFLQVFTGRMKYPMFMGLVSTITVLSGAYLYVWLSGGLRLSWIARGPGLIFTIGALVSIVSFFIGFLFMSPRGKRMGEIGAKLASAGGPPDPALLAEMRRLDGEMHTFELVEFILLSVALFTMATARYWSF
jgi:hypothetical protein